MCVCVGVCVCMCIYTKPNIYVWYIIMTYKRNYNYQPIHIETPLPENSTWKGYPVYDWCNAGPNVAGIKIQGTFLYIMVVTENPYFKETLVRRYTAYIRYITYSILYSIGIYILYYIA